MDRKENIKDLILGLPVVSFGSHGSIVKSLQNSLKRLGYYRGYYDGVAGNLTKEAIIAFQKDNCLEADGVFGPISWTTLLLDEQVISDDNETVIIDLPLSKEECEKAYAHLESVSLNTLQETAAKHELSEIELVALLSWVQGEGYWGVNDPYFGYLSACVVINCILDGWYGRGRDVVEKIASWGPYYSKEKQIERYGQGSKNPPVLKLTYLALEHLQTGIHSCYGLDEKPEKVFYDPNFKVDGKNIYIF